MLDSYYSAELVSFGKVKNVRSVSLIPGKIIRRRILLLLELFDFLVLPLSTDMGGLKSLSLLLNLSILYDIRVICHLWARYMPPIVVYLYTPKNLFPSRGF